jgi:HPt (histidine-containing phosphotransfer) domain-containing protein
MKTDLNYLKSMSGDSTELIIEMIDIFLLQIDEFYPEMISLLKEKDYNSLGKLAHKAKSSVAIMGMSNLAEKLKELELLTKENKDTSTYSAYIELFKTECDQAVQELSEYKNEHTL